MKTIPLLILFLSAASPLMCRGKAMAASTENRLTERGRYIVEQVSMCVECHTPRDQNGRLIRSEYLRGAPVPVKAPPYPNVNWAIKAPAIAGLPGYDKQEGIRLLMEGIAAGGSRPAPPMPRFRFNRADAEAVVAYLKSLDR